MNPSYGTIVRRITQARVSRGVPRSEQTPGRTTVYDCFQPGRRRIDAELVVDIVRALGLDEARVSQWRQACQVIAGRAAGAAIVSTSDTLPDDLPEFTGRREELDRLLDVIDTSAAMGTVVTLVIEGMPGVGKSTLAIHAGHLLLRRGRFSELQLTVDLRGYDSQRPPVDAAAVLADFLRGLGVPGEQIYSLDLACRAAKYRELLAGKRALIMLDDAANEDQVRSLLPGSSTCLVLITSRRALAGLPAARHLSLDVFTPVEALDLLSKAAGHYRVDADPDVPAQLANVVGYLPLALGLVASRIKDSPNSELIDHLERLVERKKRLRLDDGVEIALGVSYDDLPSDHRRMFRLLAIHPGGDLDAHAAAALADVDLDTAGRCLNELLGGNLLRQKLAGRYEFHDLVRIYVSDRAHDEDIASTRRAALDRLFDHYLHTASLAMDLVAPHEWARRPRIPDPDTPRLTLTDQESAVGWLDRERSNLIATAVYAGDHGWPTYTIALATTLFRYLEMGGHYLDALTIHSHAQRAAHHIGDRVGEVNALTSLGNVNRLQGRSERAAEQLQQALEVCRETGDRLAEARALGNLGNVQWRLGRYQQAADLFQQALALFHGIGDRLGEARALGNLGDVYLRLGRYEQASDHLHHALALFGKIGDRLGEANALNTLGFIDQRQASYDHAIKRHQRALDLFQDIGGERAGEADALDNLGLVYSLQGRYDHAIERHQRALDLFHEIGDRAGESYALDHLGTARRRQGHYDQAAKHHEEALNLFHEIGDHGGEAKALNGLGETYLATTRLREAHIQHTAALTLAAETGDLYERARGHNGLAHVHYAIGGSDKARHHWRHALAIFCALDVPDAHDVNAYLTALDAAAVDKNGR